MTRTSRLLRATVAAVSLASFPASSAFATQTASFSKFTCTVKALAPTLRSGQVTGSLQIDCNISTTVVVEMGVVEMDSGAEDRVEVPFQKRVVVVSAGRSTIVNTPTSSCVSTEQGPEELATRSRVTLSGTVSLWDRTTPQNDSYAC